MSEYINKVATVTDVPINVLHELGEIVKIASTITRYKIDAYNGGDKLINTTYVPRNEKFRLVYIDELKSAILHHGGIEHMNEVGHVTGFNHTIRPIIIARVSNAESIKCSAKYGAVIHSPEYKKLCYDMSPTFGADVRAIKESCIAFQKGCIPILKKYGLIK